MSDHTPLRDLSREVDTLQALSVALRSQNHEFSNRLHTIQTLIEIERVPEAQALAHQVSATHRSLTGRLLDGADEPLLIALLLTKTAAATERGIQVEAHLPHTLPPSPLAARELITVVGNLIDNACNAVDGTPAPRVSVELTDRAGAWVLRVADSGDGPAPTDQIFDLGVTGRPNAGHGVGLALVQHCVRSAGGRVSVTGSCFEVVIPRAPGNPPQATSDGDDIQTVQSSQSSQPPHDPQTPRGGRGGRA